MAGRFEGKVAIVTGGASGIGRATALRLASEGASVLVADRDESMGGETVGLIEAAGGTASFERVDVRSEDSVAAMVATAVERYGGLDVAHNNAGVVDSLMRITEMGSDRWGPHDRDEPEQRLLLPQARDPGDAGARWRRDREHLIGRGAARRGGTPRTTARRSTA